MYSKYLKDIKKRLEVNGIVCIENYFIESQHFERLSEEDFSDQIKKFINENLIDYIKKGGLSDYKPKEINGNNYLIKNDIDVVPILDLFVFLKEYFEPHMVKALQNELRESMPKRLKAQGISDMNKNTSFDFNSDNVFSENHKTMASFFYRGHGNINYTLIPSIYRNDLIKNENTMYNELLAAHPKEFYNSERHIDVLRKMQHYGLPTRLLDLTSNPLIGLFFAVENKFEIDGEFIILDANHDETIKSNYSDTAEILSALSTQTLNQKSELYKKAKKSIREYENKLISKYDKASAYEEMILEFNDTQQVKYLLHEIRKMTGHFEPIINPIHLFDSVFIRPLQDNDRIARQSGSFLLTGLHDLKSDSYDKTIETIDKYRYKVKNSESKSTRYVIPHHAKKKIKAQLYFLGIDESYVYPEIQFASSLIKNKYTKK